LKTFTVEWNIPAMNAVKADEAHGSQVSVLRPGDYYEPQLLGENEVLLRKAELPRRRPAFAEAMAAFESSPLRVSKSCDESRRKRGDSF
jgi:hypothetical protein